MLYTLSSAMININHPMLNGKPPIKKYPPVRTTTINPKEIMSVNVNYDKCQDIEDFYHHNHHPNKIIRDTTNDLIENADSIASETDKCVNDVKLKMRSLDINSDRNENLIEPINIINNNDNNNNNNNNNSNGSFEQLCKMINDLEGNIIDSNKKGLKVVVEEEEEQEEEVVKGEGNVVPGSKHFDVTLITDNPGDEVSSLNMMKYSNQLEPERDRSKDKCGSIGATYDDIMSFLSTLEDGYPNEIHGNQLEQRNGIIQDIFLKDGNNSSYYLNQNKNKNETLYIIIHGVRSDPLRNYFSNAYNDELFTAKLQLEEKDATIVLLKKELKKEREAACEKLKVENKNHVSMMETQEKKYQGIVKRHQKFMEKLINEKTDLTDKCNTLARRIKEIELKSERDLKVCTDRHIVELQRAKERFAASEKIKRERWLESRTTKIKEMTVKGLEPELRSMVEQHQLEIQEIRRAHMKELQDTELRVIRRSNQQLEQLRLELTDSNEKVLASEKNILWTRYKKKLDEKDIQFRTERIQFAEDLERERKRFNDELIKRDNEKDTIIRQTYTRLQKELEEERLKHQAEKQTLRESLQKEWTEWLDNYKKQQIIKLEKSESKIREESRKERDRQIELAIGRIEEDARNMKMVVQQSYESKLRSMKEKYDKELQIATDKVRLHKEELLSMENKLGKTEDRLKTTEMKLDECVQNLSNKNVLIETLTAERDNARGIARREIEPEKRILEDKIASLYQELMQNNADKDMLMSQLYSRVKLIITQKVLTIKNLSKELEGVNAKCEHLEQLLDQQRKEYILKSL
ncbi:PREDICTED: centrosomal protein of 131 kDa-like [Polistes canadensis]|uniref:centrosomal protein of 131 kDa-like n=1 Tax=Polistes canadensis TaxID=91411 RepID=UPI000718C27F|nr:PREDICTED: centrosomal protein of 131 kDa-like [Polistes canadensis]